MLSQEILIELDQKGVEYPELFCRDELLGDVRLLTALLEQSLNFSLELDSTAQDATFTCNLGCFKSDRKGKSREYLICMSFSNFGRLCLVWGDRDWLSSHEFDINTIEAILRARGFVPVRVDDVVHAYEGVHSEWEGLTWLDRFFAHF